MVLKESEGQIAEDIGDKADGDAGGCCCGCGEGHGGRGTARWGHGAVGARRGGGTARLGRGG
jgi:hypothetical protein